MDKEGESPQTISDPQHEPLEQEDAREGVVDPQGEEDAPVDHQVHQEDHQVHQEVHQVHQEDHQVHQEDHQVHQEDHLVNHWEETIIEIGTILKEMMKAVI